MKNFIKISLILVMLIVSAFMLTGCGKVDNTIKGEGDNVNNSNIKNNGLISTKSITEIKKERYPNIFGDDKALLLPPQSYIIHNILSINPNKNERLIVNSADLEPTVEYIVNGNRYEDVTIKFSKKKNIDGFEKKETINGVDIYRVKSGIKLADGTITYPSNKDEIKAENGRVIYVRRMFFNIRQSK